MALNWIGFVDRPEMVTSMLLKRVDSFNWNCYFISMKPIRFDRHAKRRIKERDIKEEEAEATLREPESTEGSVKGRVNAFKYIGNRFLRVTFKEEPDHFLVITVTMRKKPFKG